MREVKPPKTPYFLMALPWIVGIGIFVGIANLVPDVTCRDGSSSAAIGRRGACSHHGGVGGSWAFIGILPGLFGGMLTMNLIEKARSKKSEPRWTPQPTAPVKRQPPASSAPEDVLRSALMSRSQVTFLYQWEDGANLITKTVFPRWLQMAEVQGDRTLCVIADCSSSCDRSPFALSRMRNLHLIDSEMPE